MMHIDCHRVKILHHWSANDGRLLSGSLLVEFTLHDYAFQQRPLRSRLVEYVCLTIDPDDRPALSTGKLEHQACEQVRRYFDGEGQRENLFADSANRAPDGNADSILSPDDEAELQAELRMIEQELALASTPARQALPQADVRQTAPV